MRSLPLLLTAVLAPLCSSAQDLVQAAPAAPEVETLFKEGQEAYQRGSIARAVVLYTEVLKKDPDHLNAHLQRGFCHTMLKAYGPAIEDFTAVIEQKDDHLWAYTSRGSAYAKIGRHDLAMRDFDRVLQLDPKNEEAYNNRGWSKKATGDIKGACADWKTSKRMGNAEARIILDNNRCK